MNDQTQIDVDDALAAIIERLRADPDGYGGHGYGVYAQSLAGIYRRPRGAPT